MWPVYTKEYWLRETCKMAPPLNSRTARYLLKFQRPIIEILIKFIAKITEKRNPKTSPNGLKHKNIKTEFFLTILYFSDYQKFEFRES